MQLKTKEAEAIFNKLQIKRKESKHHVAGFIEVDGKPVLPVHYSFGNKDLPGRIPQLFRKSLKLDLEEFARLKGCTMSKDEYLNVLRKRLNGART